MFFNQSIWLRQYLERVSQGTILPNYLGIGKANSEENNLSLGFVLDIIWFIVQFRKRATKETFPRSLAENVQLIRKKCHLKLKVNCHFSDDAWLLYLLSQIKKAWKTLWRGSLQYIYTQLAWNQTSTFIRKEFKNVGIYATFLMPPFCHVFSKSIWLDFCF